MSNILPQLAGLIKPRDIKSETNYDIILKHYLSHSLDQLPENLMAMLKRWKLANSLIRDGLLVQEVDSDGETHQRRIFKMHKIESFLVEHFDISYRTARQDIANAKQFFLPEKTRSDKEFARGAMIDWGKEFMFKAFEDGDYKSAAAFFKALSIIQGLDRDDPELPDYAAVILPHLAIVADPSELDAGFEKLENPNQLVEEILARRKKDRMDKMIEDSELAEYDDSGEPENMA